MESLEDSATGKYLVQTESATYLLDLDRMLIGRIPHPDDTIDRSLRHDNEPITLLRVLDCAVGQPMTLCLDLGVENVEFTTRRTTPVTSIHPLILHIPKERA